MNKKTTEQKKKQTPIAKKNKMSTFAIDDAVFPQTAAGMQFQVTERFATPLTVQFYSPENQAKIKQEIERRLTEYAGVPVSWPLTREAVASMNQMLSTSAAYANLGSAALMLYNTQFIEQEVAVQKMSLNQGARYNKWFLDSYVPQIYPYPVSENRTRGEVTISTSGHMLGQAFWKAQRKCFFNDIYGQRC